MSQKPVNPYLKTKIMTASPEELRLMLYDGALKFCRQAKVSLEKKSYEESYNNLMRAQKIVLELSTSLNHNADPQLCQRLSALYTYVYRLLVDANMKRETAIVDEAIKLIEYERETWQMLMKKLTGEGKPNGTSITTAQQTAISSLSQSA
jgi:flagellar secretion chaperone FliS